MRIVEYEMIKRKETWQDKATLAIEAKKPQPREPRNYWVRLSQGQIIAKLYLYDSAKLEKPEDEDLESEAWIEYRRKKALSISKSTLRKAIDRLIDKGFLLMRSKPGDEFGAPIYTLHRVNVQKSMKELPANPYTIFNGWGVSNFESGGESQILEVPPSNIETPTSKNAKSHSQNLEVNKDSNRESSLDDTKEEGTYGADAPTPAHLKEVVDEKIEEVQRITDKHKAVQPNETSYHIAGRAIGNERVDTPGRLTLPSKDKIGASTHGRQDIHTASDNRTPDHHQRDRDLQGSPGDQNRTTDTRPYPETGEALSGFARESPEPGQASGTERATQEITSEHTPGPGALPSAADPFFGRHGNTSDQAISVSPSLDPDPAQADFPPAGSAASGTTTAQVTGFTPPKRPRGKQPPVSLTLLGSQVMQWVGEIRGAKPRMMQGNIRACNMRGFAPRISPT